MRISGWCADVCSSDLGGRAFAGRARGRSLAAGPAAPARRGLGLLLATTRAALLAAAAFVVDRGPGASLGLVLAHAAIAVALFDMLGLALLLIRVGGFFTAWHGGLQIGRASCRERVCQYV